MKKPSASFSFFRLLPRFRRRRKGVFIDGRARVADLIVSKVLLGRNDREATDANVPSRPFRQLTHRLIVEHGVA